MVFRSIAQLFIYSGKTDFSKKYNRRECTTPSVHQANYQYQGKETKQFQMTVCDTEN